MNWPAPALAVALSGSLLFAQARSAELRIYVVDVEGGKTQHAKGPRLR